MSKWKNVNAKHARKSSLLGILMQKDALTTKIICAVMAVLLALLLVPSGAMSVVHAWAVENGVMPET